MDGSFEFGCKGKKGVRMVNWDMFGANIQLYIRQTNIGNVVYIIRDYKRDVGLSCRSVGI